MNLTIFFNLCCIALFAALIPCVINELLRILFRFGKQG